MIQLTDIEIIDAIKSAVTDHTARWAKETPCTDDQVFCEHNGVCSYEIASPLGVEINKLRGELNKLATRGLICKSKNHRNRGGQCRWWPVGYLAELKAGVNAPKGGL